MREEKETLRVRFEDSKPSAHACVHTRTYARMQSRTPACKHARVHSLTYGHTLARTHSFTTKWGAITNALDTNQAPCLGRV